MTRCYQPTICGPDSKHGCFVCEPQPDDHQLTDEIEDEE